MVTVSDVLDYFSSLSALTEEERIPYISLCEECLSDIISGLKPGVNQDAHKTTIAYLAATSAYYKYAIQNFVNSGGSNLKVGDVSVSENKNLSPEEAFNLYSQALKSAGNIIADADFWFGSVVV